MNRHPKLILLLACFFGMTQTSPGQEHVPAWDTVYNLIEGADWLQKGGIAQSWTNNFALSEEVLRPYEDGQVSFKIDALFDRYKVCLATVDSSGNIAEKYTLRMEDVKVKVYEDQQWQATYNNYQVGGIYTIERAGDKLYFRKGSSAFRTITVDRDLELRAYVVIANQWVKIRRFRSTFPATIYDLPDTAYAVTWIGLSNAQHDGNGGLTKLDTSGIAGAYSLNMLGPGEPGFMRWSVQELSEDKIVGFSATGAGGFDTTAFKYGVLFHSDNSFEVYSHGTGTGSTGTVLIDDLFKLSRQGNYYYAYRIGQKIDSTAADTSHVLNSRVALGSAGAGAGAMQHSNPAQVHNGDLFALEIMYNQLEQPLVDDLGADSLFNGNIAALKWQASDGTWRTDPKAYAFNYDPLDRLVAARFAVKDVENGDYAWPVPLTNGDIFNVNLAYDLNGNIERLVRYGLVYHSLTVSPPVLYGPIDSLTYVHNGNQVAAIDDDGQDSLMTSTPNTFYNNNHFLDRGSKGIAGSFKEYEYDKNGNLIADYNKQIDIAYNPLNLPQSVEWKSGQRIDWVYSASGEKLQKIVKDSLGAVVYTKSYLGNYEYVDSSLEAIYFSEGRATPGQGGAFSFEYTITDYLGTGRVWWRWDKEDLRPEVLQAADYYPFGLEHGQAGTVQIGVVNNNKYNGKELDTDHDLNWYHYGFRMYDPILGRFPSLDPKADAFPHVSTYNYAENEPIGSIDLWGLQKYQINGKDINKGIKGHNFRKVTAEARAALKHPNAIPDLIRSENLNNNTSAVDRISENLAINGVFGSGPGSDRNAFKHGLWSASLTQAHGRIASEDLTNSHEGIALGDKGNIDWSRPFNSSDIDLADNIVDFLNNKIGRSIGVKADENTSNTDLATSVLGEFLNNGMWTATQDDDGNITITKSKISQEQYDAGIKAIENLESNGREEK